MLKKSKISQLFIVGLLCFVFTAYANAQEVQSKKELKKEARAVRKAEKQIALLKNLDSIKTLIKDSTFVLEANRLQGRRSVQNVLHPNNFIKVIGNEIIIQTANPNRFGANGLGGVTIKGRITDYDVFEDENGVRVNMQVSSTVLGQSTVSLSASANGSSSAYITGNFGSRATFSGNLVSLNSATYFEGNRLF